MNGTVLKVIKVVVAVAGVGITLASNFIADKDLDDKVAQKVADAIANSTKGES